MSLLLDAPKVGESRQVFNSFAGLPAEQYIEQVILKVDV